MTPKIILNNPVYITYLYLWFKKFRLPTCQYWQHDAVLNVGSNCHQNHMKVQLCLTPCRLLSMSVIQYTIDKCILCEFK